MRVLAFTGMPGAGKSEAVEVAKARGIPVIRMGEFVWQETRRRGLELTDANVGRVATEMREKQGRDHWARLTCNAILEHRKGAPLVIVDGVRNHEEVETFRQRLGDRFELIAITSPSEVRAERLIKRGRVDDPSAAADVRKRDERELGWGIAKSIASADHVLANNGDLSSFRKRIDEFFNRLLG